MSVHVRGLTVRLAGRRVLDDVDLEVPEGSACALIGPNGAGKSTLLSALAGLVERDDGEVRVDGVDPRSARRRELAARVSLMPQSVSFPFAFTALEVALMGRAGRRDALGHVGVDDVEAARSALAKMGVAELADRSVTRLSGGERQRVLCAMQLVQGARVVLLDEPTSALDFSGVASVVERIAELRADGRTVIAALHDLNVAASGFDRIALLHEGRIVDAGEPAAVLRGDALRTAYGDAFALVDSPMGPVIVPGRRSTIVDAR